MQIIAFVSGKGGVGKTTVTANVAVALAQRGKRVLALDLDPQNALSLHLGMDPNEIAGFIREGISMESVFNSPFGVKFIPFGRVGSSELEEFEAVLRGDSCWVKNGVNRLNPNSLDFILIDTPPGATVFLKQALNAAQRAITVVLADAASFTTIPKMLALVEEYTNARSDFSGNSLLINQMSQNSTLGHQVRNVLYASYPDCMIPVSIARDIAVSEAFAYEQPVLAFNPETKASLDIKYLVDWLASSVTE